MSIKKYINYKLKELTIEDLLKFSDLKLVRGYCKQCKKYGTVWSCPEFNFDELELLKNYQYAYIIHSKVYLKDIDESKMKEYYQNLLHTVPEVKDYKDDMGKKFNTLYFSCRFYLDDMLLKLEKNYKDSLALVSGRCLRCNPCERSKGKECITPEDIRYSLEALSIDVSSLLKNSLNEEIQWSNDESSSYITCVSALLSKTPIKIVQLEDAIIHF
ncbi:MAG: hypothetical protein KID00_10470 [Clostridium argentinense]|uniref:Metal-binding protein n=1 Tax=Clostridium faecium TaxID=2762223 RepID=A0ABR8YX91_9CLOT|nr:MULTISPECIES: DUF2284 domain-containing protein [Clostridium]MBD8048856.1 hypothetical protein [Clostridium faecium]MBS5824264.1 hypothetical protein [Clostridium argentinense]MDU1350840.1 DUF2284 domain-containing protein [Clostridium argentinense]